ncbi:MAG: HAMP domain-containing sensor histidine kinase [Bacteroidota bacterium]
MKKKFREHTNHTLLPLRPNLRWFVVGVAVVISIGSILYASNLVEQIRERESRQIEIYAKSLEFLANEGDNTNFILILDEVINANNSIPVILTDENGTPQEFRNLPRAEKMEGEKLATYLRDQVEVMQEQHPPVSVILAAPDGTVFGTTYIYYKNSALLNQLTLYPYVQLSVITLFGFATFLVLNYIKKVEQDRVWVGLAKETAHQLGTPLSSLMAWSEYLKSQYPAERSTLLEIDKDVDRLKVITDRFSSIGSEPQLSVLNITEAIEEIVSYLAKRLSSKITMNISTFPNREIEGKINQSLFAWVIENLCKNAADAMEGKGSITISILKANEGKIAIDIKDTGKGITKKRIKDVFKPGFTTKKRGWGLGLALAQRIVEQYHQGKIFVKQSEVNKGTTFRIYLNS